MRVVVGLGNPGPRYAGTRHNLGFEVVDELARRLGASWVDAPGPSQVARLLRPGRDALLVRPLTFMNRSGEALAALDPERSWVPASMLVVSDDLDLPPGRLRLKARGSDGGHRGLRSIESWLQSRDYPRLRVGVGPGPGAGGTIEHVLERPGGEEAAVLHKAVAVACLGVLTWLNSAPLAKIMSCLNRRARGA